MKEWTYLGFLAQYNRRMIGLAEGRECSLDAVVARAKEDGPVEMVDHLVAHQLTSLHHKSNSSAGTDKESKVLRQWNGNVGMYCINASPDNCWPRPIWDIVVQVKSKKIILWALFFSLSHTYPEGWVFIGTFCIRRIIGKNPNVFSLSSAKTILSRTYGRRPQELLVLQRLMQYFNKT